MWRKSLKQRAREQRINGWATALDAFAAPFDSADAKDLQSKLQGKVVLPFDATYADSRQLSNWEFQHFPQIIVYCEVFQDVWACLEFANKHNLLIATRSGGHSTAGFSVNDGMVIDTSRLNGVYVDSESKRAVVGPGTNWGHLNAALADYHLHVPTGVCGDVCVAGFMQGGGYGLTSRKWGMNCDSVVTMLVMLADGRIVRAARDCNADLFWAMRGGTGNNFGILLQVTYDLQDLPQLWGFGLEWPLENAPAALIEIQRKYTKRHAAKLGYMGALVRVGSELSPVLIMRGVYWGSSLQGRKTLKALLETTGAQLKIDRVGTFFELNESLFAGIPPCPDAAREDKQSVNIARDLSVEDWTHVCEHFALSPNPWTAVAIEPYGGAINKVERDATAFVHRRADMNVFVDVFWMDDVERDQAKSYLNSFMALLEPLGNGESYQNYPRLSQTDYRKRYWGEVFPRLLAVKRKYDPDNVFRYAQSVQPDPGTEWPTRPAGKPIVIEAWSPPAIKKSSRKSRSVHGPRS